MVGPSLLPSVPAPTLCFTLSGAPAPDSKLTLTLSSGSQIRKERKWVLPTQILWTSMQTFRYKSINIFLVTLSGGGKEIANRDEFGEEDTAVGRRDPGQRTAYFLISGEFMKSCDSDIPGCG